VTESSSDVLTPALSPGDKSKKMKKIASLMNNELLRPSAWIFITVFSLGWWCLASVLIQFIF